MAKARAGSVAKDPANDNVASETPADTIANPFIQNPTDAPNLLEATGTPSLFSIQDFELQPDSVDCERDVPIDIAELDGRFLLVTHSLGSTHLYLLDTATTEILSEAGLDSFAHPVWNPDGGSFAFSAIRDGTREICIAEISGDLSCITEGSVPSRHAVWSPDGNQVAYLQGNRVQVADLRRRYGQDQILPFDKVTALDWSGQNVLALIVSDADAERSLVLYHPETKETMTVKWDGAIASPRWDPEGSQLAFIGEAQDDEVLYIMDWSSATVRAIYRASRIESPSWSPAGKQLIFVSYGSGSGSLLLYEMQAQCLQPLTTDVIDVDSVSWGP